MNKTELTRRLSSTSGNKILLTIRQTAEATGMSRNTVAKMLSDYPHIADGRSRRYLVDDIAEALIEWRVM